MSKLPTPTFVQPLRVPVPLHGGELVVASANVGTLLAVKELLLPAIEDLARSTPELFDPLHLEVLASGLQASGVAALTAADITSLFGLLDRLGVVVDFVATLAPLPKAEVLKLMPDEFAFLFAVTVQVNADFFVQALPVFKQAAQRAGMMPGAATAAAPQAPAGTTPLPPPSTP